MSKDRMNIDDLDPSVEDIAVEQEDSDADFSEVERNISTENSGPNGVYQTLVRNNADTAVVMKVIEWVENGCPGHQPKGFARLGVPCEKGQFAQYILDVSTKDDELVFASRVLHSIDASRGKVRASVEGYLA